MYGFEHKENIKKS